MRNRLAQLSCMGIVAIVMAFGGQVLAEESAIVQSSFQDFAAGSLPDGGANVYVTASGEIQMINRLDLNNDGYLDILIGQGHNHFDTEDILLYWGGPNGPTSMMPPLAEHQPLGRLIRELHLREKGITRLPSDGGGRCVVADLNNDSRLDIVFCNYIHNYSEYMDAIIYWGTRDGFNPNRLTKLPTLMGCAVAAADFNKDGFVDLAFANNGLERSREFGLTHHLESYVYWNSALGFEEAKRSSLPTISAVDCAAGDLNNDGYPELLFVNNNAEEKSIYLYWGSDKGFSEKRRDSWKGGDPMTAELADVDRDGKLDLVISHGDGRVVISRGTGKGFEQEPLAELPALGAAEAKVADLNKDGFVDLILANKGTKEKQLSYVYWGSAEGYAKDRRLELPTLHATDVAVADFNNDGWLDLCFANEQDEKAYDINSYIYWNGPEGFDAACRSNLQGFQSVGTAAADLNQDGHQDVLLISRRSGTLKGNNDSPGSVIYWGNRRHYYSEASCSILPTSADTQAVADLDNNGYMDIVFPNGHLYWGGPNGYDIKHRQDLGMTGNGVSVADLNKDGYLDLVIPVSKERFTGKLHSQAVILWGSADGYSTKNKAELDIKAQYCQSANIADLNKDGFLDLVLADVFTPHIYLYWGDKTGYSSDRYTAIKLHSASTVEFADLNADGWLDLCIGAVYDPEKFGRPMRELTLLLGGPEGYSADRSQSLEAYESEEQAIGDLNKDGYLDLVVTNYHGYTSRSLPFFIYWGNKDTKYSAANRTQLHGESSLGVILADLNQDSWIDLIISNHQDHGDHGCGTNIFWGGPEGYSYQRSRHLQTFGSHFSGRHDIGNIYDRRLQEEYVSAPLQRPSGDKPLHLSWKSRVPHGTQVKFQVRSAADKDNLAKAAWQGPEGADSYYQESGSTLSIPAGHGWIQYRAVLATPDGGSTPVLEEVRIGPAQK